MLSAKYLARVFSLLLAFVLPSLVGAAQEQKTSSAIDATPFNSVPAEARDSLVGRLNLFLQYDRTGDYEKKFELLTEQDRKRQKMNQSEYVRFIQDLAAKGKLERNVEFRITHLKQWRSSKSHEHMMFMIYGRSTFVRGRKTKKAERLLEARFENGDWYFSDWLQELTNY